MALRSWRALTIALLLASAFPPPRVTNALIADAHRHGSAEAGKTLQARGRNRIDSEARVAPCRTIAGLSSGEKRPPRSSSFLGRRPEAPTAIRPSSPSTAPVATLRLRC